jgi:hypothetical protein
MPRGFGRIQKAAEKLAENSSEYQPVLKLRLPDSGDSATVRFLEQGDDVYSYWYHDFSHVNPKEGWKTKVPCLDQEDEGKPCPGCRDDMPRRFQGLINLIWRDAPLYKRDEDNRVVKKNGEYVVDSYEDQIAVWEAGIEVFKQLAKKDVSWNGLASRDAEVTREGLKLNTKYYVEPADLDSGPTDISKEDEELVENKYDLEQVARFADADHFEKIVEKYGKSEDDDAEEDDGDIEEWLNDKPFEDE